MFEIIIDTREQYPWDFKSPLIMKTEKLDSGDYSIAGHEDKFVIERKATTSELFKNVTEKRFTEEIERLSDYKKAFIICEFPFDYIIDYPIGSTIPKRYWKGLRVKPQFVIKFLSNIQIKYGINIIYAGSRDNAIIIAQSLMKEYHGNREI